MACVCVFSGLYVRVDYEDDCLREGVQKIRGPNKLVPPVPNHPYTLMDQSTRLGPATLHDYAPGGQCGSLIKTHCRSVNFLVSREEGKVSAQLIPPLDPLRFADKLLCQRAAKPAPESDMKCRRPISTHAIHFKLISLKPTIS